MTDSNRIDPERLAALLDGRLGDADASAVRRQLADTDAATLAAFADAAAVAAELEGAADMPAPDAGPSPATTVAPIESARSARRRRRWVVPAAAAAAAAIVSVIVWRPARDVYAPEAYARALPSSVSTAYGPVWSVTRGAGNNLPPRVRAARIGATLVDLEVAARSGQSTRASALSLANLLDGTTAGSSIATSIRALPEDSLGKLSTTDAATVGRQSLNILEAREFAHVGAYLEAARLASAAGDASFFDTAPRAPLGELETVQPPIDASQRDALATLNARLQERPRSAPAIHTAILALLRAITQ